MPCRSHPEGPPSASASADRTVKLWSLASGKRGKTLPDATAELYAMAYSPDGSTLFAAGVDRSIRAWRVAEESAPLVKSAFAHDAAVLRLVASADGKTLVSSGEDRDVKLWDLATLTPRLALPEQPDWPQAIALNREATRLAVGRHDGTVAIYEATTGKLLNTLTTASSKPVVAQVEKPELVRDATLNPPSPRGGTRGASVRLTLTGNGVGNATELIFKEAGLAATIVPSKPLNPNRLEVDLAISAEARIGLHKLGVVTSRGVPVFQSFAVEAHPGSVEIEPNDDPSMIKMVVLPAVLLGTIERPGDVDHFKFQAREGQQLVFSTTARVLGSSLRGLLTLLDDQGRTVAESAPVEGNADPLLTVTIPVDGVYSLRIADVDYGGSGNHFYRIAVGDEPYLSAVFPLGIARGRATTVQIEGMNLAGVSEVKISPTSQAGTLVEVTPTGLARPILRRTVVVCDGPQKVENEPNDEPSRAEQISTPGGITARIDHAGDVDHVQFLAKKGERLIVEVFGRRLGTPIDPIIEIVDDQGRTLPRAVLKPVAETEVAFRDHDSTKTGIRLTRWNNLAINDTVLIGREVARIFALPRNPDDDCLFWSEGGQRLGFLETTPEHHPMGQPIYKVEVHPPGATFPPGGVAALTLDYRNDDGGPGYNKDARLTFDPPRDGAFLVRVGDARGLGGESFRYHLVVRRPHPDFEVVASPENPSIPRGSTALVNISLTRQDSFDVPVDVTADHLPVGVTSTTTRIERGSTTAILSLSADASAPAFSPPGWRLTACEVTDSEASTGASIRHEINPGGTVWGRITVKSGQNLTVRATPTRVVIRPGQEVTLKLAVDRGVAFAGRVPIEVRNLPQGVRVLNVGLNGVLVTEKQTERTVTLYAEPWVEAMERPFFAVGRAESAGTESSTEPITLVVETEPKPLGSTADHSSR